jgi:hypothetical protein
MHSRPWPQPQQRRQPVIEISGPYVSHIPEGARRSTIYVSHGTGWIALDENDVRKARPIAGEGGVQPVAVVGRPGVRFRR